MSDGCARASVCPSVSARGTLRAEMADREVHVGVVVGNEELIAGRLWSHRGRGVESATFAYDAQYLTH